MTKVKQFPSPLEVDRFLYLSIVYVREKTYLMFPSPLEVDRF